jgi:hypothetical protein
MKHRPGHALSAEMAQCIDECTDCHRICVSTARHCLEQGGEHAAPGHITVLLDCAAICQTSADFMIRGSDLHGRVCAICAEACNLCAESCEAFGEDKLMQECAEACRRCARSCEQMAA